MTDLSWIFDLTEDDLPTVAEIVPELVLARLRVAIAARVKGRTQVGTVFILTKSGHAFGLPLVEK